MSTVYNKTLFEVAHRRMRQAPLELTETDFTQLAAIDPALETKGRAAQRDAQLALVHTHMPALQTKAASPDRSPRPITWTQLEKLGTFLIETVAKNVLPLREEVAQLKARVLELEAAAAAREEVSHHADR